MDQGQQTLAQAIRAKYPGAYDDMSDAELERAVLAKYPQYADFPKTPEGPIAKRQEHIGPAPETPTPPFEGGPIREFPQTPEEYQSNKRKAAMLPMILSVGAGPAVGAIGGVTTAVGRGLADKKSTGEIVKDAAIYGGAPIVLGGLSRLAQQPLEDASLALFRHGMDRGPKPFRMEDLLPGVLGEMASRPLAANLGVGYTAAKIAADPRTELLISRGLHEVAKRPNWPANVLQAALTALLAGKQPDQR